MNKKEIIFGLVVLFLVTIGAIVFLMSRNTAQVADNGATPQAGTKTDQGTVVANGTNPISDTGQVVTKTGEAVKLDVVPGTPDAPQQSNPVAKDALPSSVTKISVSAGGFDPADFTVKSGEAISLSITSSDSQTHVFKFDDPALLAVAVGVGPGETRVISFNAPAKGEYGFYCDVPGHRARGEVGKMIVK